MKIFSAIFGAGLLVTVLANHVAFCAEVSVGDFYRGKVMNIYVGVIEGGAIDTYPRIMSDYLSKYLPGKPTVIVRNMTGASGVSATNYIYGVAPQDGTVLGFVTRGVIYAPLFNMPGAKFDPKKMNWIGSSARETSIIAVWSSSTTVKTISDVLNQEVIVGATPGSVGNMDILPELMNRLVGTKFKVIRGYNGGPQVLLAMENGEIQGRGAWSWGSLKSSKMDWYTGGKVRILVQFGLQKANDLPDVPLALDLAKNADDRELMEMICAPISIGYPSFQGPQVLHDRVEMVRQAYGATLRDPEFLAIAKQRQLEIDPVTGEEIRQVIDRIYAMPEPVIANAKAILGSSLN